MRRQQADEIRTGMTAGPDESEFDAMAERAWAAFAEALDDDLNGPRALAAVFQMAKVAVPRDLFRRVLDIIAALRARQVARC